MHGSVRSRPRWATSPCPRQVRRCGSVTPPCDTWSGAQLRTDDTSLTSLTQILAARCVLQCTMSRVSHRPCVALPALRASLTWTCVSSPSVIQSNAAKKKLEKVESSETAHKVAHVVVLDACVLTCAADR